MPKHASFPRTAQAQMARLPNREKLEQITLDLHDRVIEIVREAGAQFTRTSYRTKTDERMREKLERRGPENPILDIHGIRLIMQRDQMQTALEAIRRAWPTPEMFPWGISTLRDYASLDVGDRGNRYSDSDYKAIHLNIVFDRGARIAEIQLYTPADLVVAERTETAYKARQKGVILD